MFDFMHLAVYTAIAILFYLLGVLGARRSKKANAYADALYMRAKAAEAKLREHGIEIPR